MFYYSGAHQLADGTVLAVGGQNYSNEGEYYNNTWALVTLSDKSLTVAKVNGMYMNSIPESRVAFNFLDRKGKTWIVMGGYASGTQYNRVLGLKVGLALQSAQKAMYTTTKTSYGPLACWLDEDAGKMLLMYSDGLIRHVITAQINDGNDAVSFNSDNTVIGSVTSTSSASMPAVDIAEGANVNTFVYATGTGDSKLILAKFENGTYTELDTLNLSSYGTYLPTENCTTIRGKHLRKVGDMYILFMNPGDGTTSATTLLTFFIDPKTNKFVDVRTTTISGIKSRVAFAMGENFKLILSSGADPMTCTTRGISGVVTKTPNSSSSITGITGKKGILGDLVEVIVPK